LTQAHATRNLRAIDPDLPQFPLDNAACQICQAITPLAIAPEVEAIRRRMIDAAGVWLIHRGVDAATALLIA
jgi:hypothetical protein